MRRRVRQAQSGRLMIYFAANWTGFHDVEIGQLERLIVFLGHPIYGLTVVLFVLLLASSLGSFVFGQNLWMDLASACRACGLHFCQPVHHA